jgi:hypothetical protein
VLTVGYCSRHTFRDSNRCTKCGEPAPLFHASCGTPITWKKLATPKGAEDPPDPGLGLYCATCDRFVQRTEWSEPGALPVTLG